MRFPLRKLAKTKLTVMRMTGSTSNSSNLEEIHFCFSSPSFTNVSWFLISSHHRPSHRHEETKFGCNRGQCAGWWVVWNRRGSRIVQLRYEGMACIIPYISVHQDWSWLWIAKYNQLPQLCVCNRSIMWNDRFEWVRERFAKLSHWWRPQHAMQPIATGVIYSHARC